MALSEPTDIRFMRACLHSWPLPRGKGALMRLFGRRLRNRAFLIEVEKGIFVPGDLDDYMIYWRFLHGQRGEPMLQLARRLIQPGDTVVDVGANIGLWVMGAALKAGSAGRIEAFEPVPENMRRLRANLTLNGLEWVRCSPLALSDHSGCATFFQSRNGNSGMGSLAEHAGVPSQAIQIELATLDGYLEENAIRRVDFLKVDVEGAELLVFRGASTLLAGPRKPVILFEANEPLARSFGSSSLAVKSLLQENGYGIYRYARGRLKQIGLEAGQKHEDLLALAPKHFQRFAWLGGLVAS